MAPTFVSATTAIQGSTALGNSTTSFSVAVVGGQTLVLKIGTGDSPVKVTGVSDNVGNTWVARAAIDSHSAWGTSYVYSAFATTTATITITVSLTSTESSSTGIPQAYALERWSGAMINTTPATNTDWWAATTQSSITTTGTNSVVTWTSTDWVPVTTGTPAYGSGSATAAAYRSTLANVFFASQTSASAGAQAYGMTSPSGMKVTAAALELLSAQRFNLCPNPSFEIDTTGWSSLGAGSATVGAVTRLVTAGAVSGAAEGYVSAYGGAGSGVAYVRGPNAPVTAGTSYTASIYRNDITGTSGWIGIDWLDSTGTQTGTSVTGATSTVSGRYAVSGTAPTGATQARLFFAEFVAASASSGSPQYVFVDAAQVELTSTWNGAYFDGDTSGAAWQGITQKSASAISSTTYPGAATLASTSSLSADGRNLGGHAALASTSSSTATANGTLGAAATLASTSSLKATLAPLQVSATLASTSASSFTAGPPVAPAQATLASTSWLTIGAQVTEQARGALVSTSTLTVHAEKFTPAFIRPGGPVVPPVKTPKMRLLVANTMTGRINYELPWDTLTWNSPLNSAGTVNSEIVVEAMLDSIYQQGEDDPALVLREFLTGPWRWSLAVAYGNDVLWAGPYLPSQDPPDKSTVTIQGVELEKMFDRRLVYNSNLGGVYLGWGNAYDDLKLVGTTLPGIVYSLVQNAITPNGLIPNRSLPITCANPPAMIGTEARTYHAYDLMTTSKAISDIVTADGGPDWRLDPYLVQGGDGNYLRWELRIGNPTIDTAPVYTWDDTLALVQRDIDASSMATSVWVPGNGQDQDKLIQWRVSGTDPTSLSGRGFPSLEVVNGDHSSETDPVILGSWANAHLAAGAQAVDTWTLKVPVDTDPPAGAYRPGDMAGIDIARHRAITPGSYRRRITELSGDGSTFIQIVCGDADTAPTG